MSGWAQNIAESEKITDGTDYDIVHFCTTSGHIKSSTVETSKYDFILSSTKSFKQVETSVIKRSLYTFFPKCRKLVQ